MCIHIHPSYDEHVRSIEAQCSSKGSQRDDTNLVARCYSSIEENDFLRINPPAADVAVTPTPVPRAGRK